MNVPKLYHSALTDEIPDLQELDFYYANGNTVICHNIIDGPLPIFKKADVAYTEPAWRQGYETFANRTDEDVKTHNEYLKAIQDYAESTDKPVFIIGGKHMTKIIKPHHTVEDVKLHGYKSLLFIWNHEPIEAKDNKEVIEYLSKKFNCVLDFSCGYGNAAKEFKNFVCADVNKKCIYYIAKTLMGYDA